MAAPVAMIGYGLLGTSHQLVVSATTATSAVSAATVGRLAGGDAGKFAALSAMLALVTGVVLVLGGLARFGAVADLVSKPVMTGFLFGLGLVIALAQVPSLLGVAAGEGNFFPRLWDLLGDLGDVDVTTLAVGGGSLAVLLVGRRLAPSVPWTLLVLVLAIAVSAILGLSSHGVDVVGDIPRALPDPAIPHVGASDIVSLIAPALGVLVLTAEGVGVARALATKHGYASDPNRDLVAMGASNLLSGFSSGFVQSGGASQTAAADGAGARSQLAAIIAGGFVLLTGAFLAPLFEDLPQAALAAIVIVAVSGFWDVASLRRFAHIRREAIAFAGLALAGVLVLGVLQGLVVTALLLLVYVVARISRPTVMPLVRDPADATWHRADHRPDLAPPVGSVVVRTEAPLLYRTRTTSRSVSWRSRGQPIRPPASSCSTALTAQLDVGSIDVLAELATETKRDGRTLVLAEVRAAVRDILVRAGVTDGLRREHRRRGARITQTGRCVAARGRRSIRVSAPSPKELIR
jgi:MFS superfamily sulfate permease-like transporter